MTKSEKEKISKIISELDTATGMLLVPAMQNKLASEAMKIIVEANIKLGELFD